MSHQIVNLQRFQRTGTTGQVPVRDTSNADGFAWTDDNGFRASGQAPVAFGAGLDHVTVFVSDGQVSVGSQIQVSMQLALDRQSDEWEFDRCDAYVGAITPFSGYDVVVVPHSPQNTPHGNYLLNYARK